MCKEKNIHYFNDDYMHGLYKSPISDKYDTGAGFYLSAKKYKNVDIKCENYILHYGNGSWNKIGRKHKYTVDEWLKTYKRYWSDKKNKMVIYTCITGNYDNLLEPKFISKDFDYICFTDNKNLKGDIWDIRPLPKETEDLSKVKKQRFVKINPHLLLKEYDISIWVDGNVTLRGDLKNFVNESLKDDCSVYVPKHPSRNCIYDEANVVLRMKKDVSTITNPQMDRYKSEGFPKKYGLLQSNILLRRHNDEGCKKLMESWFNEVKNGSHRDQLSFNYASWKNKDVKITYLDKYIYKSKYFFWNGSHTRSKIYDVYDSENEPIISSSITPNKRNNKSSSQFKSKFRNLMYTQKLYDNRLSTFNVRIY